MREHKSGTSTDAKGYLTSLRGMCPRVMPKSTFMLFLFRRYEI